MSNSVSRRGRLAMAAFAIAAAVLASSPAAADWGGYGWNHPRRHWAPPVYGYWRAPPPVYYRPPFLPPPPFARLPFQPPPIVYAPRYAPPAYWGGY